MCACVVLFPLLPWLAKKMCVWCLLPCGVGVLVCGCCGTSVCTFPCLVVCPSPAVRPDGSNRLVDRRDRSVIQLLWFCVWCAHLHVMYFSVVVVVVVVVARALALHC